jgi:hypothetical protein
MSACDHLTSGALELHYYGELDPAEQRVIEDHLPSCADCRLALEELALIRRALATRPVVDAPPNGDWSAFTARLEAAVRLEDESRQLRVVPFRASPSPAVARARFRYAPYLATAALLALATMTLAYLARSGAERTPDAVATVQTPRPAAPEAPVETATSTQAGFAQLSERHFERSKLVVLGLANKDPRRASEADWEYERQLASSLLTDTRLYRQAAEENGMRSLADVMADLELVLLQTSLAQASDADVLEQIQRLIQKRNLVTKMDVVGTTTTGL